MEIVITGQRVGIVRKFKEFAQYRELLYFFVWRDFKVRYKQTFLGVLWVVIQPVLLVLIFSFIFRALDVGGAIPYPVLAFIGIFFWQLFSNIVTNVGNSIVANQNIIQKIYFPNILIPVSATIVSLIDALIVLVLLLIVFLIYHVAITWVFGLLCLVGLIITLSFGLGVGLFLGALNVKYRDVRYVLPFFIQVLFFLSPVVYDLGHVPQKFAIILKYNPLSGGINGVRAALSGFHAVPWNDVGTAVALAIVVLIIGLFVFNRLEKYFSDLI